MLLAAGRGERMRPLSDATPKSLLCAGGKPLVVWLIERLAAAGVRDLVINHAHQGRKIEQALGDGSALGVRIRYSPESPALETAGGIVKALPLLGAEPFIAVNADVFTDYDFSRLVGFGELKLAHLVVVPNPDHNRAGDFGLERSQMLNEPREFTFSGIGLYREELFAGLRPGEPAKLAPLLRQAIEHHSVSGELHRGLWRDIGTPQRLAELDAELSRK